MNSISTRVTTDTYYLATMLLALILITPTILAQKVIEKEESTEDGIYYTNIWAVKVVTGTDADKLAQHYGFRNEGEILEEEDDGTFFEFKHPKVKKNSTEPHHVSVLCSMLIIIISMIMPALHLPFRTLGCLPRLWF